MGNIIFQERFPNGFGGRRFYEGIGNEEWQLFLLWLEQLC